MLRGLSTIEMVPAAFPLLAPRVLPAALEHVRLLEPTLNPGVPPLADRGLRIEVRSSIRGARVEGFRVTV